MRIPVILLALTVHETAHGYMAYKLGDPTAKSMGRLSLNPLKHLDPFGTLMMLLVGFGWAQPVPIDARYFKKPKRDMALTALAGPASNIILAFIGLLLYRVLYAVFVAANIGGTIASVILLFFNVFYILNLSFAVFNLLPIPPLDGSRAFLIFLPDKYYFGIMRYERYIMLALMLAMITGILDTPLSALINLILRAMNAIISLIPFI